MQALPYLFFNGDCRAALTAYGEVFGTPPELMETSAMPPGEMEIPADRADWIMHGSVAVGGGVIYASDNITGRSDVMAGCSVMVSTETEAEARRVFEALSDGGEITMPFMPTFWSAGFGTCVDRFGIRWMVGTDEVPEAS